MSTGWVSLSPHVHPFRTDKEVACFQPALKLPTYSGGLDGIRRGSRHKSVAFVYTKEHLGRYKRTGQDSSS